MTRYICDCEELALPREEYCESCDQYKKLEQELETYKRLYEERGKALARPCIECGHVSATIWARGEK